MEVGAVERPASDTDVTSAVRAFADNRLHVDTSVIAQFKDCREGLSLLGGEAVKHYTPCREKFGYLLVRHLPVSEDAIDVQTATGIFTDVVLTAVPLAGLDHVAAAQRAASNDFLFCFHSDIKVCFRFILSQHVDGVPLQNKSVDDILAGHHRSPSLRVEREPQVVP